MDLTPRTATSTVAGDVQYTLKSTVGLVVCLGVVFMLQFSAYLSYLNLISQIYAQENFDSLGNVAIFTLYGSFAMGSLVATNFAQKFPLKKVMFVCSVGVTFYVSQGLYISGCAAVNEREPPGESGPWICTKGAVYTIVVVIGLIAGFFDSALWISQSGYLDAICERFPPRTGIFFGTFWSLMETSQVVGMLIAWQTLKHVSQFYYFLTVTCLSAFSSALFLFLPSVQAKASTVMQQVSLRRTIKSVYRTTTVNARVTYPQFVYFAFGGVIIAFYSGIFHVVIEGSLDAPPGDKEYVNVHTTYVFLALGLAEIVTGVLSGTLNQKFSLHTLMIAQLFVALAGMVLSFINYYTRSYALCFVCGVLFGCSDCAYMNLSCLCSSKDFRGRLEAFSLFKFYQGVCVAVILILNICLPPLLPILCICTALNVAAIGACFRLRTPTNEEAK